MSRAGDYVDEFDAAGLWRRIYSHLPPSDRPRPALFLDRDGTIIEPSPYLADPALVRVIPEAMTTIARANALAMPVVIVTNQSGIGRGYFDWPTYYAVEDAVAAAVLAAGARLDAVYACPSKPADRGGTAPFGRKPDPGMLTTAAAELNIDPAASWIAGDSVTDIDAGRRAHLRGGWLVPTGFGDRDAAAARALDDDGYEIIIGEPLDGLASRFS